MNLKMCNRGHYYDADVYGSCPQCANDDTYGTTSGATAPMSGGGYGMQQNGYAGTDAYGETEPLTDDRFVDMGTTGNTFNQMYDGGVNQGGFGGYADSSQTIGETQPVTHGFEPSGGPTEGTNIFNNRVVEDIQPTQPIFVNGVSGFEPVTGWLVCIDGPERGKDYHIRPGYNTIGRAETNTICIRGDNAISREKAATIGYDDMDKSFFFGPSDSHNIVRVNNKGVIGQTYIKAYDVLTIGSSKFLFIPLCGEHFDWNTDGEK